MRMMPWEVAILRFRGKINVAVPEADSIRDSRG
jgi:hypothetical protein